MLNIDVEQLRLVRQVGKTEFARAEHYEAFTLTDRHREEFFRDGATLLKGLQSMIIELSFYVVF